MSRPSNEERELQKKQAGDVAALFGQTSYTGYENTDSSYFSIPFVKIAQSNSPQLLEDSPSYIKGLKAGHFFNVNTGKAYGKELKLVIMGTVHQFIEWGDGLGNFVKSYTPEEYANLSDAEKNKTVKTKDGEKLCIQETFNVFAYLPDFPEDGIVIFPISSTKIKYFRKWMAFSLARKNPSRPADPAPIFASVWKLTTALNENATGKWYNIGSGSAATITCEGWIEDKDASNIVNALTLVKEYIKNSKRIDYSASSEVQDDEGQTEM